MEARSFSTLFYGQPVLIVTDPILAHALIDHQCQQRWNLPHPKTIDPHLYFVWMDRMDLNPTPRGAYAGTVGKDGGRDKMGLVKLSVEIQETPLLTCDWNTPPIRTKQDGWRPWMAGVHLDEETRDLLCALNDPELMLAYAAAFALDLLDDLYEVFLSREDRHEYLWLKQHRDFIGLAELITQKRREMLTQPFGLAFPSSPENLERIQAAYTSHPLAQATS